MASTEIAIILLLIVANGIFAMAEIAVVASRRTRLQHRAERGDRRAAAALRLAQHPTQFLSTVQVGITLVGIFAGAYGGATLADPLAERLAAWPWLAPYSRLAALAVVVTAITYFSLVIGELVPKAIALSNPEGIAARVAAPLAAVARVTTPFVRVLSASTSVVLAVLRVRVPVEHRVTEEEIRALVKQAAVSGDVAPVEQKIVEQVFRLGDRRVSGIMTPRHDIDWFDVRQGLEALGRHVAETRHARSLVCDGSLDAVLGVLHAEDLLEAMLAGRRPDMVALLRPPLFVPATLSVFELLERFRSSRVHVALVLDEFGAIEGLVTPTDILEGLVGEMPAEEAPEAGPMVQREDGSWLVDGTTPLEDLGTAVSLPPVPAGEEGAYRTLAGLVMTRLGRVPRVGDRVVWGGYRLEVVDMDGRRVDKVLIEPVSGGDAAASKR